MAVALIVAALILILLGVFVLKALLVFGIVAAVIGVVLFFVGDRSFFGSRFRR